MQSLIIEKVWTHNETFQFNRQNLKKGDKAEHLEGLILFQQIRK